MDGFEIAGGWWRKWPVPQRKELTFGLTLAQSRRRFAPRLIRRVGPTESREGFEAGVADSLRATRRLQKSPMQLDDLRQREVTH